jgi:chromosome segregation ATPase
LEQKVSGLTTASRKDAATLKSQFDALQAEHANCSRQRDQLKDKVSELHDLLARAADEVAGTVASRETELLDQQTAWEAERTALEKQIRTARDEASRWKSGCRREIHQKDLEITRLSARAEELRQSLVGAREENAAQKTKIAKLQSQRTQYAARLKVERAKQDDLSEKCQQLFAGVQTQRKANRILVGELQVLQDHNESLSEFRSRVTELTDIEPSA